MFLYMENRDDTPFYYALPTLTIIPQFSIIRGLVSHVRIRDRLRKAEVFPEHLASNLTPGVQIPECGGLPAVWWLASCSTDLADLAPLPDLLRTMLLFTIMDRGKK